MLLSRELAPLAGVLLVEDHRDAGTRVQHVSRAVGGSVVDHHDLGIGVRRGDPPQEPRRWSALR
jgi:hypothetical protein